MKIALLAKGESLKRFPGGPFDEVWGLNQIGKTHKLDRLYVMDDFERRLPAWWQPEELEWLKSYEGRVITSKACWGAEEFPLVEVARHFGIPLGLSFYSTVDYMLAHGIYEGVECMDLYGIDCAHPKREERERVSIARWIAVAQSRGIRVITHPGSFFNWYTMPGVCYEQGLYGYSGPPRIEELADL